MTAPTEELVGVLVVDEPVTRVRLAALEEAIAAEVAGRSGIVATVGADRWGEFETFVRTVSSDAASQLGVDIASSGISSIRRVAAGEGGTGLLLAWAMVRQATNGSLGDGGKVTVDESHEVVEGGKRSVGQLTGVIQFSRTGSRVVASVDLTMQVEVFDAATGAPLGSTTFRSAGRVEIDFCPDGGGSIAGHASLVIEGSSGGASASSTVDVAITGTVGDDAFLRSVEAETSAADTTTSSDGSTGEVAIEVVGTFEMGPEGSLVGGRVTRDTGRVTRDTANASQASIDALVQRQAMGMGLILDSISSVAQEQWRGGACLEIRSTEGGRTVRPSESVPFTASLHHRFEGRELDKPILSSFEGVRSVDPVDIETPAPVQLVFTAGSARDDTGTVHLESTSNRGIATLDVTFRVAIPGWVIDRAFPGGHILGSKCGDPNGEWIVDGTYDQAGMLGVQRWTITIDAGSGSGTFTYTDDASGRPGGAPVIVYSEGRAAGTVTFSIDPGGRALMHLTETSHTYQSWTELGGGSGWEMFPDLAESDLIWEVGGVCGP